MKDNKLPKIIQYHLVQNYLEVARSILDKPLIDLYKLHDEKNIELNQAMNVVYALFSMSCIYSCLAIESLCNAQLYKQWEYIQMVKNNIKKLNLLSPSLLVGKRFYREYNRYTKEDFLYTKQFKGRVAKKDLKNKLNDLCNALKIDKIAHPSSKYWSALEFLLKRRNFFVHPKPHPEEFNRFAKEIFKKDKPSMYYLVASEIIRYFYNATQTKEPDWLSKNTLFKFSGISEIIHPAKNR